MRAVEIGRDIYRRITTYVKLQLTILSSVLQLMLYATILNINDGVALFPLQLMFCKFFVVVTVVIGFIVDVPDPGVMQRPPRKPGTQDRHPPQIVRWAVSGFVLAVTALPVLVWGPDEPSTTHPSVSMTMAFAIVSLSAVNLGFVMRREREAPWSSPLFPYMGWIILGWILTWAAVELSMLQRLLDTTSLTRRAVAGRDRALAHHAGARRRRQGRPAVTPTQDRCGDICDRESPADGPPIRLSKPTQWLPLLLARRLGFEVLLGREQLPAGVSADGRVLRVDLDQRVREDRGHREPREPLVVRGHDVPGRPRRARRGQHLLERALILVPVLALVRRRPAENFQFFSGRRSGARNRCRCSSLRRFRNIFTTLMPLPTR